MTSYLTEISSRLSKVIIENRDFEKLINVYDKKDSLIYCDPPYFGTEKYYQVTFSHDDHIRLLNTLKYIEGKFILSYNDCGFIREIYKNYNIEPVERIHNLCTRYEKHEKRYNELIITNF